MELQIVTISVASLATARRFYEGILGFVPDLYYEPTRWQSYRLEGNGGFAVIETPALGRVPTSDIVNFTVGDVESLWSRIKDQVDVEFALAPTPWGTYKFVVRDPDGFRLGFAGRRENQ